MKKIKKSKILSFRKNFRIVGIALYSVTLFALCILGLLFPLRPKVSDVEKRKLTEFPKFTMSSFVSGDFLEQVSLWYSDTFPLREKFLAANSKVMSLYGISSEELHGVAGEADEIPDTFLEPSTNDDNNDPTMPDDSETTGTEENTENPTDNSNTEEATSTTEPVTEEPTEAPTEEPTEESTEAPQGGVVVEPQRAGAIYISGDTAFSIYYFGLDSVNQYIVTINNFADYLKGTADVYCIAVPTSIGMFLSEEKQKELGGSSPSSASNYILGSFSKNVKKVPVFDALYSHRDEYIYFRTDHHWTALGAYYAYVEYAKAAGFTPVDINSLEKVAFDNFLGTHYANSNQSSQLAANPDTVYAYKVKGADRLTFYDANLNGRDWPIINDVSTYNPGNKYSCFIAGDNPLTIIKNPSAPIDGGVLIFKDSYGNPFSAFLANSYKEVHIIDYRYMTINTKDYCKKNNIKSVIFLNNLDHIGSWTAGFLNKSLIQ